MIDVGYQHIDDDDLPLLSLVNRYGPEAIRETLDPEQINSALYYGWIDEAYVLTEKGRNDYEAAKACGRIKPRKRKSK